LDTRLTSLAGHQLNSGEPLGHPSDQHGRPSAEQNDRLLRSMGVQRTAEGPPPETPWQPTPARRSRNSGRWNDRGPKTGSAVVGVQRRFQMIPTLSGCVENPGIKAP